ncbi:MAG: amidohydrolase family protein [Candidatus Pacebacteria bacterium]|nr:amidohydrolase family protein [Candidatus Paceibacterota bacterium]
MAHDVIIKNGIIFDGTGAIPVRADLAIDNGKVNDVGNYKNDNAAVVIDASNLYIMPGFIDITNHSDTHWTIFSQPKQESLLRQGITTIIGGHGGVSLAPFLNSEMLDGLNRWVDTSEININWQTVKEFLESAQKIKIPLNFGTFVGHETLRASILKGEVRAASKKELSEMLNLLDNALKEGAFGLTTNLGIPQGQAASDEEIKSLFAMTARHKLLTSHHLENEGKNMLPSISRLINFLRTSGAKGHIAHLKAIGRSAWESFPNALNMIELASKEGVTLSCDFFPYTRTGSNLMSLLPSWALAEKKEIIMGLLNDEESKRHILEYLETLTLHYDRITIASASRDFSIVGKTINKISEDSGLSCGEVVLKLLETNELRVSIFNEVISPENIKDLAKKPYSMISTDGVGYEIEKIQNQKDMPHPRSFGSFPKVFDWLVKEEGILTWESAVRKMTSLPAETLGIKDRGVLRKGYWADVVVIDPQKIKGESDYNNPFKYADGTQYVFVNGSLVLAENKLAENYGGTILKSND